MNTRKALIVASLALAGALAAGAAHAGPDVFWSVGVNLPVYPNVSIGVSSAPPVVYRQPVYRHAPVVVAPAPRVVYVPQPVYARRALPVYAPAPVIVHPQHRWQRHDRRHDRRDRDDRWNRRDRDDRRWGR